MTQLRAHSLCLRCPIATTCRIGCRYARHYDRHVSDAVSIANSSSIGALSALYRDHFAAVRGYLVRRLGCAEAGREAAQDVFLKLLLRPQEEAIRNPRGFLLRSARNLAIDMLRADGARPLLEPIEDHEDFLLDPASDPARIAEARQRLRALSDGIERLPPRCRDVFFLHRFEGLTHKEIAGKLGITAKNVEAHLARAMLHLRGRWVA